MNDPQLPSFMGEDALGNNQEHDFGNLLDFDPFLDSSEHGRPISGIASAKPSRTTPLEQELANVRNENLRLRQQLGSKEQLSGSNTSYQTSANSTRGVALSSLHDNNLSGLTGAAERDPMPSITTVLNEPAIESGRTGSRTARSASRRLSPASMSLQRDGRESYLQPRNKSRTHLSRPFRGPSRITHDFNNAPSDLEGASEDPRSLARGEDQKRFDDLLAKFESTKGEIAKLHTRCTELETRFNTKSNDTNLDMEKERDERFCTYFDWVFDFIEETVHLLEQQNLELPPKLINVYKNVCNIGP